MLCLGGGREGSREIESRREELHDCRKGNIRMPRRWEGVQGMSLLNVGVEGVLLSAGKETVVCLGDGRVCRGEGEARGVLSTS